MKGKQLWAGWFILAAACYLIISGLWFGLRTSPPAGVMNLMLGGYFVWSGSSGESTSSDEDGGWQIRRRKRTQRLRECALYGAILGLWLSMTISSVMTTVGAPPDNPRTVVEADYQLFGVKLFQFKGPYAEAKVVWERINGIIGMVIVAAVAGAGFGLARLILGKPEINLSAVGSSSKPSA